MNTVLKMLYPLALFQYMYYICIVTLILSLLLGYSTICQWSIHTATCVSVFTGHQAYIYSLVVVYVKKFHYGIILCRISVFAGTGDIRFLSSGEDKTIRVWKGELHHYFITIHCDTVYLLIILCHCI